ncbi:MAG: ASCH domain-containing protein [Cyanobacteria bacterium P01_D01_bin.44]
MVAYNFKQQFVPLIRSGSKKHTIRTIGKRRHARPGELVQLYCGQRTAHCFKILDGDPECVRTADFVLYSAPEGFVWQLDGVTLDEAQRTELACNDGFQNAEQMFDFFRSRLPFEGMLIEWGTPGW